MSLLSLYRIREAKSLLERYTFLYNVLYRKYTSIKEMNNLQIKSIMSMVNTGKRDRRVISRYFRKKVSPSLRYRMYEYTYGTKWIP
jgi:uncharacterized membrane protein YobD (UPF0266 family)